MSAIILQPPQWRRDQRYELRVWLLNSMDYSGPAPTKLRPVWEVARCPDHMNWFDPLEQFDEDQRDSAIEWARAYAAAHPDHFFGGEVG